jgi:hypothetical protein
MPWSGGSFTRTNGVHTGSTLWVQDRDAGTKILATRHDTHDQDLADGINSTLEKSGSNAATGDLDIGSNRITLTADGTATQDVATINQLQNNAPAFQATDTGTANAYVIALSPAVAAYAAGQAFTFKAANASTTASTLNVNTIGTKVIKKLNDQDIASGDIESGSIVSVVYDGTSFQMTSQLASSATSTPGGSNTQVQYNSSGAFAGSANLTFDASTLTVTGTSSLDGAVTINQTGAAVDFRVEGENVANGIFLDASQDALSFGGANVDGAAATFNNLQKRTMVTAVGTQVHLPVQTTTFDNASSTVAIGAGLYIGTPSWGNDNATLTMTNAATLYIQDAPGVGSNVAFTNPYALLVDAGLTRLDGGVTFGDETLDTYDEGTWTPTVYGVGTAGTQTYLTQSGWYIKIGNMCFAGYYVRINPGGTMAGAVQMGGLPFSSYTSTTNESSSGGLASYRNINLASTGQVGMVIGANVTYGRYIESIDDGTEAEVQASALSNGHLIIGCAVYRTT